MRLLLLLLLRQMAHHWTTNSVLLHLMLLVHLVTNLRAGMRRRDHLIRKRIVRKRLLRFRVHSNAVEIRRLLVTGQLVVHTEVR